MRLIPKLEVLPEGQSHLWPQLRDTPDSFVLYGGTAVALRYGHRISVDFDFFSTEKMDLRKATEKLPYIKKYPYSIIQQSTNHIDYFLSVNESTVKITYLNDPDIIPGRVGMPQKTKDNNLQIASPADLMACKILAIHNRTVEKDYLDIAELIANGVSLQKGFESVFALVKKSYAWKETLNLEYLKEDLCSKTLNNILIGNKEAVKTIQDAAMHINIDKVLQSRAKIHQKLSSKGLGW